MSRHLLRSRGSRLADHPDAPASRGIRAGRPDRDRPYAIALLRSLARLLDVPERTLRRAAAEGMVHGRRVSERRYETTLREEMYLREHWPLLRMLRTALRTEPNVRLAVLFGSVATGRESERSDLDLLVVLGDQTAHAVAALAQRLSDRVNREVQLVRLQEAERSPALMADALAQGRVLVDRDDTWRALKAAERRWQRKAAADTTPLLHSAPDLGLS
jgi:predicted nucleotidyltransferase